MPYLTGAEIAERLTERFPNLPEVTVGDGDAEIASAELDGSGPFIGGRLAEDQELAFPRDTLPNGDENTEDDVPDAILDWVALNAAQISRDEAPGIKSESRSGLSVTYSGATRSPFARRKSGLLIPWLRPGYATTEVASTFNNGYSDSFAWWELPTP